MASAMWSCRSLVWEFLTSIRVRLDTKLSTLKESGLAKGHKTYTWPHHCSFPVMTSLASSTPLHNKPYFTMVILFIQSQICKVLEQSLYAGWNQAGQNQKSIKSKTWNHFWLWSMPSKIPWAKSVLLSWDIKDLQDYVFDTRLYKLCVPLKWTWILHRSF